MALGDVRAHFDLDAYCQRIGYDGPRTPSLDTLRALHASHPAAIPFENLDPLLGQPVRLDLESLQEKLLRNGRGGYCFEHNLLFSAALQTLGFPVVGLAARVLWGAPAGIVRPRSHMLLIVEHAGTRYIVDVGFGGLTLTAPLRFEIDSEQSTPHEAFRIVRGGDHFVLEAGINGVWAPIYRFTEEIQLPVDYEVANWYTSTHPSSIFVTSLMAARAIPGARLTLSNSEFTIRRRDGSTERQRLPDGQAIESVLRLQFGISLPESPKLAATLDRLVATSNAFH